MLRGAYGLYYDAPSQDFFLAQSFPNGNVGTNPVPGLGTFTVNFTGPVPFGPGVNTFGGVNSPVPPFTVFGVDQHMRTPYVQSYNFNLQQTMVEGTVLQVGYVGSKGTKLFRVRDINQATAGPVETLQQRRPFNSAYPQFAGIYQLEASSNADYNALQAVLRRRLSKGLTTVRRRMSGRIPSTMLRTDSAPVRPVFRCRRTVSIRARRKRSPVSTSGSALLSTSFTIWIR